MVHTDAVTIRKRSALFNHASDRLCINEEKGEKRKGKLTKIE